MMNRMALHIELQASFEYLMHAADNHQYARTTYKIRILYVIFGPPWI